MGRQYSNKEVRSCGSTGQLPSPSYLARQATAALIQGSYCILPLASSFPYRRSSMVGFPARRPATHVAESKHLTNVMMELSSPKSAAGRYASRRPVSASFDALRKLDLHVSVGVCCTSSATQTKHAAMTLERGADCGGWPAKEGRTHSAAGQVPTGDQALCFTRVSCLIKKLAQAHISGGGIGGEAE